MWVCLGSLISRGAHRVSACMRWSLPTRRDRSLLRKISPSPVAHMLARKGIDLECRRRQPVVAQGNDELTPNQVAEVRSNNRLTFQDATRSQRGADGRLHRRNRARLSEPRFRQAPSRSAAQPPRPSPPSQSAGENTFSLLPPSSSSPTTSTAFQSPVLLDPSLCYTTAFRLGLYQKGADTAK